MGHGYFCSAFLSPLINRRDDEFGGSLENRAKVARGIVHGRAAARSADQIAVTAKLNMSDGVRGGITVDEAMITAKWLEEDGGLDAIELTAGSSLVNPMYLFRGDVPAQGVRERLQSADAVGHADDRQEVPARIPLPRGVSAATWHVNSAPS